MSVKKHKKMMKRVNDNFHNIHDLKTNKLAITDKIENFENEEVQANLRYLYDCDDTIIKKLGTLINSIFYHHRQVFLLSKWIFVQMIKDDPNVKFNSISTSHYKELLHRLLASNFLIRLREPTAIKAGVYKLTNPGLVKLLHEFQSQEFFEYQEVITLKLYDEYKSKKVDYKEIMKECEEIKKEENNE